jgi:hypothetical protein
MAPRTPEQEEDLSANRCSLRRSSLRSSDVRGALAVQDPSTPRARSANGLLLCILCVFYVGSVIPKRSRLGLRAQPYRNLAVIVIGTAASAREIGQFFFAVSAKVWNCSAVIPGTAPARSR